VRLAAARGLAGRNPGDPRLAALFSDPEPELRAEAVRLCGRDHPECLTGLLAAESPIVLVAIFALLADCPKLLAKDAVVPAVRAALSGAVAEVAADAALAFAAVSPEQAVEDLAAQVGDPERPLAVRLGAARALAWLGGERAIETLAAVLGDDERELRLKAMAGLAALTEVEEIWPNRAGEILLAALRGDLVPEPEPEPELEPDPKPESAPEPEPAASTGEAAAAAEPAFPASTLESMLGEQAMPAAELTRDGPPVELTQEDLDRLALAARGAGKKVVPVMPRVAPHQDVRRFAARVLGDVARVEVAVELARELAQAPGAGDLELRRAAADSLARMSERLSALPGQVTDVLLQVLTDGDRDIRLFAIRALGAAGGSGAVRVVEAQLKNPDSFVRAEALRALDRLGSAGPGVEAAIEDPDPGVRLAAARAVAHASGARAVDLLCGFAFGFEGYHRRDAGRLLRRLDRAAANERFLEALEDHDSLRLRPVAIAVLEELNRTDGPPVNGSTDKNTQREGAGVS
jgi:HEAT repeat protein